MSKVLIVMTCRNNLKYSRACFKSLQAQTVKNLTILIVDNASTDGTASWARSEAAKDSRVITLFSSAVQSVSTLWNLALNYAWAQDYKKALLVNNDTELLPETYEILSSWSDCGLVTCVSRREGESLAYDRISSRPHPDFSCFLIHKWAFDRVGGFDENCVGAHFEDNCFHVEAHRAGIKCVSLSLPFLHHGGATVKNADPPEKIRIDTNFSKNKAYFFSKYGCYPGTKGYEALFQ